MDSFEWNKIAGAVLATLLLVIGLNTVSEALYATAPASDDAYIVEGVLAEGEVAAVAVAAAEPPIGELLLTASIEKGERVAKKCLSCHVFEDGGANKIGPALWGIVGRDIATQSGFSYSDALAEKSGIWDINALNAFLKNPKQYASGTSMAFIGLRKAGDRANIIAYLQSLNN